jgi:hypothetical protein
MTIAIPQAVLTTLLAIAIPTAAFSTVPPLVVQPASPDSTLLIADSSPVEPAPIGTVLLLAGQVNVQLKNMTDTQITYEAIGHTQQRNLGAKTDIVLQDLPTPVTITFLRPDAGFVRVTMAENSESGTLVLTLDEATDPSDSQISVSIQSNGNVLAY